MTDEESFKVTDRRGRPREVVAPEAAIPVSAEAPQSTPEAAGRPARAAHSEDAALSLQGLFAMLATSALIGLGEAPDPATGEHRGDLEQAREAIDILLLLRTKTEGNRTELETRLLEEILYDLQLRFLRLAGRS